MVEVLKTEDELLFIINAFLASTDENNPDMMKVAAPDLLIRLGNGPEIHGIKEAMQSLYIVAGALADVETKITSWGTAGAMIMSEWRLTARVRIDPGFNYFSINGCSILHIHTEGPHKGLVRRFHCYFDNNDILDRMYSLGAF